MRPRTRSTVSRLTVVAAIAVCFGCEGRIREPGAGPDGVTGDPGRITMHRLNRVEYNNTVRDLLGTDQRPADEFPFDDYGYGFDNIADVLSLSPAHIELHQRAVASLIDEAMDPDRGLATTLLEAEDLGSDRGAVYASAWRLTNATAITAPVDVAADGEYRFTVRAWGEQAGPDPARMALSVDGAELRVFDVTVTEADPTEYEVTTALTAGAHTISAAFVNDYYVAEQGLDRNLVVDWLRLQGPLDAPHDNPTREGILVCDPADTGEAACTRDIVRAFGKRAWRRPLTDDEVESLARVADEARAAGDDFDTSIELSLQAAMLSPHFLFRVEIDPNPTSLTPHPVTDYELASRLSYFLWSSMPDDALFDVADAGALNDPDVLRVQIDRMLDDDKAVALVENFASQWLFLRGLDEHEPDYAVFPDFTEDLKQSMRRETELLFEAFLREDIGIDGLLTADFTYVNAALAAHYGLPYEGEGFQRVSLAGTDRTGLLTQGAMMTVTSYPTRTSPVKRGKWVLEQLLCSEPPPPPPGVEGLPDDIEGGSLREQMERHRTDPACAACHVEMDAIGFGLEHFDAVGAYRTEYTDAPVDATGELAGAAFDGARELAQVLSRDPRFIECVVEKMYTYGLGRGPETHDAADLKRINRALAEGGYTLRELIALVATSEPFRFRRGEPTTGGQ